MYIATTFAFPLMPGGIATVAVAVPPAFPPVVAATIVGLSRSHESSAPPSSSYVTNVKLTVPVIAGLAAFEATVAVSMIGAPRVAVEAPSASVVVVGFKASPRGDEVVRVDRAEARSPRRSRRPR